MRLLKRESIPRRCPASAPVVAYVRIDDKEIELREPVLDPNLLIIQDPTLFTAIDIFAGLRGDGYVLINSSKSLAELGIEEATMKLAANRVVVVPATDLALKHLKRPTPNTVMLGAFTAICDTVQIESVCKAIMKKFPGKIGEMNVEAARAAHDAAVIA